MKLLFKKKKQTTKTTTNHLINLIKVPFNFHSCVLTAGPPDF